MAAGDWLPRLGGACGSGCCRHRGSLGSAHWSCCCVERAARRGDHFRLRCRRRGPRGSRFCAPGAAAGANTFGLRIAASSRRNRPHNVCNALTVKLRTGCNAVPRHDHWHSVTAKVSGGTTARCIREACPLEPAFSDRRRHSAGSLRVVGPAARRGQPVQWTYHRGRGVRLTATLPLKRALGNRARLPASARQHPVSRRARAMSPCARACAVVAARTRTLMSASRTSQPPRRRTPRRCSLGRTVERWPAGLATTATLARSLLAPAAQPRRGHWDALAWGSNGTARRSYGLTPRQLEVLELVAQGKTNPEIATEPVPQPQDGQAPPGQRLRPPGRFVPHRRDGSLHPRGPGVGLPLVAVNAVASA